MGITVKSMSSVPVCVTSILGLRLWNFDAVGGKRGYNNERPCKLYMTY